MNANNYRLGLITYFSYLVDFFYTFFKSQYLNPHMYYSSVLLFKQLKMANSHTIREDTYKQK